jgi:hypothetical protein
LIPELFTVQPVWLIILCILLAAVYATILYFRENKNEFGNLLKIILATTRFLAVFIIASMLLSPFIRHITRMKERPVVILALDNSQSMVLTADSSAYRQYLAADLDELAGSIEAVAEPRRYLFGEELRQVSEDDGFSGMAVFSDRLTDFSGMLAELGNLYDNRNVGALVIASDGIFNTGSNPVYLSKDLPFPVYTLALGDTTIRRDLLVLKVNYNRLVYLDNQYPIEVVVHAHAAAGTRSRIKISQGGQVVATQDVIIEKDDLTGTFQFLLEARQSGLNKLSISLDPVDGELSVNNNRKDIYIEVLDSRIRVLLVSAAPHPDISALRQAITSNQNYELEESLLRDFKGDPGSFNLVILHQLPFQGEPASGLLKQIADQRIPALFILGAKSDLIRFNQARAGLIVLAGRPAMEEATPAWNSDFLTFSISEGTRNWFVGLPPLISPLGDYQVANSARVLMYQRLGSVETSRPLILFNETLDGRTGVMAGEGIWKWRLYDYVRNGSHDAFNELVNKTVQYLSLKEQKKKFRIYQQTNFLENQQVEFDAELYNDNYELINSPDVGITIQNEDGRQFQFVFNKAGNAYHLNCGSFPPGNYSFTAKVTDNSQYPPESGQFSVSALDLESLNTIADHNVLFQLAQENQGALYNRDQLDDLGEELLKREDIRPVTYARKSYEDLINKWWVVALIIGFLTLEWFLRKRAGGY